MERRTNLGAIKTSLKIRKHVKDLGDPKTVSDKVNSPIARYDSAGNLSCILCRMVIKSSKVWKVHINSKQHKRSIELAKQNESTAAGNTDLPLETTKTTPSVQKTHKPVSPVSIATNFVIGEVIRPSVSVAPVEEEAAPSNEIMAFEKEFFDQEKSSKSHINDQDEEWVRFQREIKEATTASNIIIAEELEDINIKRQLKEINDQIENWNRFIKVNDRKNVLVKKQRKPRKIDLESESSADSSGEDLVDWRDKSLHKKH